MQSIPMQPIHANERAALERLLRVAKTDTGQARRVADFLLAWWNANDCGGFDPTDMWAIDDDLAADMVTLFAFIARGRCYPSSLGFTGEYQAVLDAWRPAVMKSEV